MIFRWQRAVGWAAVVVVFGLSLSSVRAGVTDVKGDGVRLRAQLVWGTNEDSSPDSSHKALEGSLRKKLAGVFKWKNYFEVKRLDESIASKSSKRLKLSPKCEVEIKNLGGGMIAAKLFGDGKAVLDQKINISSREPVVLGGHDKDKTAWFVVLSPL